jgi:hypothetical protein
LLIFLNPLLVKRSGDVPDHFLKKNNRRNKISHGCYYLNSAKLTCKPSSVPLYEVMIIYLGLPLPTASSDLTREQSGQLPCSSIWSCSRWGLQGQPVT